MLLRAKASGPRLKPRGELNSQEKWFQKKEEKSLKNTGGGPYHWPDPNKKETRGRRTKRGVQLERVWPEVKKETKTSPWLHKLHQVGDKQRTSYGHGPHEEQGKVKTTNDTRKWAGANDKWYYSEERGVKGGGITPMGIVSGGGLIKPRGLKS